MQKINTTNYKEKYGDINYTAETSKFYEFTDSQEAKNWGSRAYQDWSEKYKEVMDGSKRKLPPQCNNMAFSSIECYCGYMYSNINTFLRSEIDDKNDMIIVIENYLL